MSKEHLHSASLLEASELLRAGSTLGDHSMAVRERANASSRLVRSFIDPGQVRTDASLTRHTQQRTLLL
eukprot:1491968-Alexandrium_andersonii.AAC.1